MNLTVVVSYTLITSVFLDNYFQSFNCILIETDFLNLKFNFDTSQILINMYDGNIWGKKRGQFYSLTLPATVHETLVRLNKYTFSHDKGLATIKT